MCACTRMILIFSILLSCTDQKTIDSSVEQVSNWCEASLVFGTGDPNAELMLIGEAPGKEEDLKGEPFVGRAGKLLNKILAAIDKNRNDGVFITNVLKCRPPKNRDPLA